MARRGITQIQEEVAKKLRTEYDRFRPIPGESVEDDDIRTFTRKHIETLVGTIGDAYAARDQHFRREAWYEAALGRDTLDYRCLNPECPEMGSCDGQCAANFGVPRSVGAKQGTDRA